MTRLGRIVWGALYIILGENDIDFVYFIKIHYLSYSMKKKRENIALISPLSQEYKTGPNMILNLVRGPPGN